MQLIKTVLGNVHLFKRNRFVDERGTFERLFCADTFKAVGADIDVAQINIATNPHIHTLRGMHFQLGEAAETKCVSCISGKLYDVVVDVRPNSATFLQWHGFELSADEPSVLIVPKGFAHGYLTLEPNSALVYSHSHRYEPDKQTGINYADPAVGIDWGYKPKLISSKDQEHKFIDKNFQGYLGD